jgi:hypothetical protein
MKRMRNRRTASRERRAFDQAIRQAPSESMRRELLEMITRN